MGKCEGCSAESSKERKRELRSLWPRMSKSRRTKKQRELKSNSAHSNKKLTAAAEAASARPLDRCSDIIDNTISASHKAAAPTEHPEQARQAAHTLINSLQGLCAAAGPVTVADEPEDPMMDFDGSDDQFRQMLSKASQDEEIARSVRRRLTYKRSLTGKEIPTVKTTGDPLLAPHTTHRKTRSRNRQRQIPQPKRTITQSQVRSRHKQPHRPKLTETCACTDATWQECKNRASNVLSHASSKILWHTQVAQMEKDSLESRPGYTDLC